MNSIKLILLSFTSVMSLLSFTSSFASSQETNVTFNNVVYSFYKVKAPYKLASLFCKATNSTLVNIRTRDIQILINTQVRLTRWLTDFSNNQLGYWVGGRRNQDNIWVWSDGSPIPINNSSAFQYSQMPEISDSTVSAPSCLAVNSRVYPVGNTGRWLIQSCSFYNYFICQRDLSSISTPDFESESSFECDNSLLFGIIIFLVVCAFLLLLTLFLLAMKFRQMRHKTDDYIKKHHQPLTKISVDGATPPITNTSEETDIITDLPLNRGILSDAGYEVVNSNAPSRGRQYDQPTYELAERIRGESELYMEIPDNLTSNKRRKNSSLWRKQSPYLDMRGSKDSSDMAKTLPR